MEKLELKDFLKFNSVKDITYLYKNFLIVLEDIMQNHAIMLRKLELELPEEYHALVRCSDTFTPEVFKQLRKRVLDAGNESARNAANVIDKILQ